MSGPEEPRVPLVPPLHPHRTLRAGRGVTSGRDVMAVHTDGQTPIEAGLLKAVPWFAACSDEQLADVARLAERLQIEAGEVILREGRLGRELFVILEGTATVTRGGTGRERDRSRGLLRRAGGDRSHSTQRHGDGHDRSRRADHRATPVRDDDRHPGIPQGPPGQHEPSHSRADDRLAAYGDHVDDLDGDGDGHGEAARSATRTRRATTTPSPTEIAASVRLGGALSQPVQPHGERRLFCRTEQHRHPLGLLLGPAPPQRPGQFDLGRGHEGR